VFSYRSTAKSARVRPNLQVPHKSAHNVVHLKNEHESVYAFAPDVQILLWPRRFTSFLFAALFKSELPIFLRTPLTRTNLGIHHNLQIQSDAAGTNH
jgi:hypothetical protein